MENRTYDPVTGLELTDAELESSREARLFRQNLLGSVEECNSMNRAGL